MTSRLRSLSRFLALGLLAVGLTLSASPPAAAQTTAPGVPDALFDALKAATSEAEGREIAAQIWRIWLTGPDAEATERLAEAMTRRRVSDLAGAHDILDALVADYPDWAETWNQRAFVRFLQARYEESLADVAEVLAREPRHFGALSGRALILFQEGRFERGQRALRETLEVHPWSPERRMLTSPTEPPGQPI